MSRSPSRPAPKTDGLDGGNTGRLTTQYGTLRSKSFCKQIRDRDRGCVLTDLMALDPEDDNYGMFEAGHIFPLAPEVRTPSY